MDYPIKTLSQLRPILQGFRKAAGLTQAMMASRLGVTQQTYAQLEANPSSASVERLFKVLRTLNVGLALTQSTKPPSTASHAESVSPRSRQNAATEDRAAVARAATSSRGKSRITDHRSVEKNATTCSGESTEMKTATKKARAPKGSKGPGTKPDAAESFPAMGGVTGKKREDW